MNQFSDLTPEEFTKLVSRPLPPRRFGAVSDAGESPAAAPVDWRSAPVDWRSKLTPVKNQGACGSCWAFSATGAVESAYAIATGALRSLSEEDLVECAREPYGNLGCAGGDFVGAFEYLLAAKGLDSEVDYPYTARDGFGGGRCWTAAAERHVAAIDGYSIVKSNSSAARRSGVCLDPLPDTSSPR